MAQSVERRRAQNMASTSTQNDAERRATQKMCLCVSEKIPPLNSLYLSQINRFSKFLYSQKKYEIFLQDPYDITNFTLGMMLHYLGKLNIQILCRYSAYMEKMQTLQCLLLSLLFHSNPPTHNNNNNNNNNKFAQSNLGTGPRRGSCARIEDP